MSAEKHQELRERAAGRSHSKAEFIARIGLVLEEADETVSWLELVSESGIVPTSKLSDLLAEANERLAIFAASRRTAVIECSHSNCAWLPRASS